MIAAGSIAALDLIESGDELRRQLAANSDQFRSLMTGAGFTLAGGGHPIIPVMLGDARLATEMSERLLDEGIYVIGFSFPVVPRGSGPDPNPDVGVAHQRRYRHGGRRLRQGRPGALGVVP